MKWNSKHEEIARLLVKGPSGENVAASPPGVTDPSQVLHQRLVEFGELARAASQQTDEFWQRQRAAIKSRIRAEEEFRPSGVIAGWAGIAALVVLGVLLLSGARSSVPAPATTQADTDHDLLIAVEHDMQTDVPDALQPAALLAREMNEGLQARSPNSRSTKEKANED